MIAQPRFDLLSEFFGAWFHQDWNLDASDWLGVVKVFLADSDHDDVTKTARELRAFLALEITEDELVCLLKQFGCYYTPRPDLGGPSYREWLTEVRKALEP